MSVYLISYGASYLFARAGFYWLSGIILILAALFLYWRDYRRTENIIHLRGLFSLFWVGGEGIACLKLSELSFDWNIITWLCFLVAFLGFWVTFEFFAKLQGESGGQRSSWFSFNGYERPLFLSMAFVTFVSLAGFIIEAAVLGFIPFFVKGVPHAYSTFHITGIHYFTVSCVLVPSLSVLYLCIEQGEKRLKAGSGRDHGRHRMPDSCFVCVPLSAYSGCGISRPHLYCNGAQAEAGLWGGTGSGNDPHLCDPHRCQRP